jgi:hypothetical protein
MRGVNIPMDMNEEINEILRLAGLPLLEAAPSAKRLLPMFQNILELDPDLQKTVEQEINFARRILEREDRVIWHLRYVQISLMRALIAELNSTNPEVADRLSANTDKKVKQLAMKAGVSPQQIEEAGVFVLYHSEYKRNMEHYMGMPVPAIQNHIFQYELPQPLMASWEKAAEEWADDQDRVVDLDKDAEIVIDFGNGVAWWNLLKPYCPIEGDCMGHCGNSPRENTDDTILSLRKEFPTDGEMRYSCMATFILTHNGMLTEMKGRGNKKPAPRYHKYIVPLLRHDIVEGIIGGGYMPEENFSLGHLEEEGLKQQLIDEKPSLAGPTYFIEKAWDAGEYEKAAHELEKLMDAQGLDTPGTVEFDLTHADKGMHAVDVIMNEWDNYEAVVDDIEDGAPQSLFALLEEIDDLIVTKENIDESIDGEFLVHVFEALPLRLVISVARALGINPSEDQHAMARKIAKTLEKEGDSNRFYEYVVDAAHKAIDSSAVNHQVEKIKEQIVERLEAYASAGVRYQPYNINVHEMDRNNPVFGPWRMTIGMREVLDIAAAGMTMGGEDAYEDDDYNAWAHWSSSDGMQVEYDHHGTSDHRGKYGNDPDMELGDMNEKDKLAAEFDEDQLTLAMDQLINNTTAILNQTLRTGITPASDKSKQQELSLEARRREAAFQAELAEIKRLAGFPIV